MQLNNSNLNISEFDAVIFDMDGVLVNSEPFYFEVEKKLFKQIGLNITDEEHHTFQGTATDLMWKIIIQKYGLSNNVEEMVDLTDSIVTPYFQSLQKIDPMPGVKELILALTNRKIPLALASSSYPNVINIILQKTGLKEYFDIVVNSKMAGSSKPEPDIFLLAAKKLGILPEKCLVIEDSTNGIKAAKSAGMRCIAFAGPGSEYQNQKAADWIIKDFNEILV